MIDCTKAREPANFKRMFGKDTGIKDDFSLLTRLPRYNWCLTGSFDTFLWRHQALVSTRKTVAQLDCANCNVLLWAMKTRTEVFMFSLSPSTFQSSQFCYLHVITENVFLLIASFIRENCISPIHFTLFCLCVQK